MNKHKNIILICVMAVFLFGFSFWCWGKEADEFSDSERRVLAGFPELTWETIISGDFMEKFETYAMDQFPARDSFRAVKSAAVLGIFRQMDNNGLYMEDGHISKLEYPMNKPMLEYAAERFQYLFDSYMKGTDANVYLSIVPDKNYFLAEKGNKLAVNYEEMTAYIKERTSYMEYIDITDLLSVEDYYRTDTHWKQEQIIDVADRLAEKMGVTLDDEYKVNTLDVPFYGVYYGQLALPVAPDTLQYLTSDTLENCVVTSFDTGFPEEKAVYDMEEAYGKDPYEMFLAGSSALVTVENLNASTEKELIVFRDSFAGSLVPLLVEGYKKVTLVDIRYVESEMLGGMLAIDNQDVLFLYSSMLLNNSLGLR